MWQQLRFPGRVTLTQFSKRAGHWYVSIQVEVDDSWNYPHRCKTQAAVGVDLGVRDLAVFSTGERIEAPRALRKAEAKLRRLSKELARRKKGGKNHEKTKRKLARAHAWIAYIRSDVSHKLTTDIVRRFRYVGVENLNVSEMLKNHYLASSISDAGMSEVRRQLEYKAELAGLEIVVADRWFPSSKTCSDCGHIIGSLPLHIREWVCPECGIIHDRDVNAAVNLRKLAAAHAATAQCLGSSDVGPTVNVKLPSDWESSSYVNQ